MKTITLVTGATGQIGRILIKALVSRGESVRALILPGEDTSMLTGLDVDLVMGNVLDPASLDQALAGVDYVLHLAGIISILPGANDQLMSQVNVEGARNVARAALKAGVRRMVHTSSVHMFQRLPHGEVVDENTPLIDENEEVTYDQTKAGGAREVLAAVEDGLDAVIVCPSGVIGPGQISEMGGIMTSFVRNPYPVIIEGSYDFVDVRDVVDGIIRARDYGQKGRIYILSGTETTIEGLFNHMRILLKATGKALVLPYKLALRIAALTESFYRTFKRTPRLTRYSIKTLMDNSLFSRERAEEELGYRPRPLADTLNDIILYTRNMAKKISRKKTLSSE